MAILIQANRLVAGGKPAEAAPLFGQLAQTMEANQHPRRAANFHALAANTFADAKAGPAALEHAQAAMRLFIQYQMNQRTAAFYANITRKMNGQGMQAASAQMEKEFGASVKQLPAVPAAAPTQHRGVLPTNCTKCGAPIHGSEANWVDDITIECEYCGVMIRATQ